MDKKDKKKLVEELLESISRLENIIVMETSNGNKRASDSAKRVLDALKVRLKEIKSQ